MSKILQGKVISNKMNSTAIVEVSRRISHPLYKKILKKSKKYKIETLGQKLEAGQLVKIIQIRPVSKDKHFAIFTDGKKQVQAQSLRMTGSKEKKK